MMWHAALRGAIALTLCMQLGDWVDALDGPGTRQALQTGTYLMICVFLIVFGGSTQFLLRKLGIPMGSAVPKNLLYNRETSGWFHDAAHYVNEHVMMPLFVGEDRKSDFRPQDHDTDVEQSLAMSMALGRTMKRRSSHLEM